jgi:hypothetical protein
MKTLPKIIMSMVLGAAMAGGAVAANLPTEKQCREGYKQGMEWTKEQFDAACTKVETNAVPGTSEK